MRTILVVLSIIVLFHVSCSDDQTPNMTPSTTSGIAGTSWQFVQFQGGDDQVLIPDDRSKYTITFASDGVVNVRFDCNRGRGTWESAVANQLEFGAMALTKVKCPPESLHDHFVSQWQNIRSYTINDGHLFLSLMADGGIFEFEPMNETK